MFLRGATVGSATRIALAGHPPWAKIALNYATPFVVSSLGFLAGRRRRHIERLAALLAETDAG